MRTKTKKFLTKIPKDFPKIKDAKFFRRKLLQLKNTAVLERIGDFPW